MGGVYAGSITFTAEDGTYFWYSIELESKGQKNIQDIDISSIVRKETSVEIPLPNMTDERIEYIARIQGRDLHGYTKLSVEANSSRNYILSFLPLDVYNLDGTVTFTNSKVGEILYKVHTRSSEEKAKKVPLFQAEIGKFCE